MLRSGIEVDANGVYTALYGLVERVFQQGLIYIVLILSHTNALGIYFHKFCQWVHQSATDAYGSTYCYILIWKLVARNLRSGVDRGS